MSDLKRSTQNKSSSFFALTFELKSYLRRWYKRGNICNTNRAKVYKTLFQVLKKIQKVFSEKS